MFKLRSVFWDGELLPRKYTIDGEGIAPPLHWEGVPPGTKSFALTMTDSDAPPQMWPGVFVHWIVYDIPALPGQEEISQGKTLKNNYADFGMMDKAVGYGPPWPPDKAHRYVFTLYALKCEYLLINPDANYATFWKALLPETIAATTLTGIYGPAKTPLPG